jgi:hypothetical protein
MVLVNTPLGYAVCLECHAIDREHSQEWLAVHTHHEGESAERLRSKRRHPAAKGPRFRRAMVPAN